MSMNGFYKVAQTGGSYVVATFYNPTTGEVKITCVRDYDYADCSRDKDDLYYMEIDHDARAKWLHSQGIICEGDTVMVTKGRKVKIGTVARVDRIKPVYDKYKRWVADYAYFDNGQRTNVNNCILVVS